MTRCVNLDWFECFCVEPRESRDADYFRSVGFRVIERPYGTRVWQQMFTICSYDDDEPFMEVRRLPWSASTSMFICEGGCHLRLSNRTCYFDNAALLMREFIERYGYQFVRITRVDVCLDFFRFDSGDYPEKFMKRYIQGRYSKVNQTSVGAYGQDTWTERSWNSVSWGQRTSAVSTKLYCKTLELREVRDKPYIRQAWFLSGLVNDPVELTAINSDGSVCKPEIWRLEFSIKSDGRKVMLVHNDGQAPDPARHLREGKRVILPNDFNAWNGREQLWNMFSTLIPKYFRFKHYVEGKRKDKCPDKKLFQLSEADFYKTEKLFASKSLLNPYQSLILKLERLLSSTIDPDISKSIMNVIAYLRSSISSSDVHFDQDLLKALRLQLHLADARSKSASVSLDRLIQMLNDADIF